MIVGSGLIATAFKNEFAHCEDTIIFASGVSNSQEHDCSAFARERALLESFRKENRKMVYFSTCSIYDPELAHTPYVRHKHDMEILVRQCVRHAIFRLPQVVGKTSNTKTLTNYLYAKIVHSEHFNVWQNAQRNLIDITDVVSIATFFLRELKIEHQIINIACPTSLSITELVKTFESVTGKKANYSLVEAGGSYHIETDIAANIAKQAGVNFDDTYIARVIKKYYGH